MGMAWEKLASAPAKCFQYLDTLKGLAFKLFQLFKFWSPPSRI